MSKIKFLSIALLLALSLSACSHTSKSERAYYKYLKKASAAREVQRKKMSKQQRPQMPSQRPAPTPPPEQEVVTNAESQ